MNNEMYSACRNYLERLGLAEYNAQAIEWKKKHKNLKQFRYVPTEYHRKLIDALRLRDEGAFKGIKLEQGYASTIGS